MRLGERFIYYFLILLTDLEDGVTAETISLLTLHLCICHLTVTSMYSVSLYKNTYHYVLDLYLFPYNLSSDFVLVSRLL